MPKAIRTKDSEIIRICAWCDEPQDEESRRAMEELADIKATVSAISHGICERCLEVELDKI